MLDTQVRNEDVVEHVQGVLLKTAGHVRCVSINQSMEVLGKGKNVVLNVNV